MGRTWVFIDEFGDVKFGARNSDHFGLGCITTRDPESACSILDEIRHRQWCTAHVNRGGFHAHDDCPSIRSVVFGAFALVPLVRVDVVALTKANVYEPLKSPQSIYRAALKVLLRYVIPRLPVTEELVVVAAEWQPVRDLKPLMREVLTTASYHHPVLWTGALETLQAPSYAHPCLQLADYACWASHRRRTKAEHQWWSQVSAGRPASDFTVC